MIRRKVSTGILRATKAAPSTSNAAQAVGGSPMQQQSANLASAVLLNSQRNWKGETVVVLKGELKKRGLSQTGNKTTLVARLSSAETSQHLPPVPSFRQLSTSSPLSKKSTPAKEEDTATVKNDKEMTTGPEISSKTEEAEAFEEPTKEELNVAPGLPESGKVAPSSGEKLSMKMPTQEAESSAEQVIPLEPDNFKAKVEEQISQDEGKENDVPAKVMTVASASTHISGGPVSAVHNSTDSADADSHESKSASKSDSKSKSSESKDKSSDADAEASAGESLAHAVNHLTNLSKNAGEFTRSFIPEIGLPKPPKGKGEEYKPSGKGLDDQEKKGLWVLGGIVGLGLLLGGPKKEKKNGGGHGGHLGGLVEKVKGEKGVQGDDEWAKASGAGVVGHGSRKD